MQARGVTTEGGSAAKDNSGPESGRNGSRQRSASRSSRVAVDERRRAGFGAAHRPGAWRAIGGLEIAEIVAHDASAPPNADAHPVSRNDAWCLIVQLDGRSALLHGGATFSLETGGLFLVESGVSLSRCQMKRSRMIVIHLPHPLMQTHLPMHPRAPCIIDGRDAMAIVIGSIARSLLKTARPLCKREEAGVRDALVHLTAAAYCARKDACREHAPTRRTNPRPARSTFTRKLDDAAALDRRVPLGPVAESRHGGGAESDIDPASAPSFETGGNVVHRLRSRQTA